MSQAPDFRSEKSESVEGKGIARGRWETFVDQLTPSVVEAAFEDRYQAFGAATGTTRAEAADASS